jgi:hypothetical protein
MKIISVIFLSLLFMGEGFAGTPQHLDHQEKASGAMHHAKSGHESHSEQGETHHGEMSFSGREHAVTQTSREGLYKLTLFSNQSPIPLQKIHSWTLHVETADGKPVDNLKIYVNGGMPMHRHGFPTRPKVSDHLGGGDYRVDGLKFNMAGHWEMRFNITEKGKPVGRGKEDRAVFKIHLK